LGIERSSIKHLVAKVDPGNIASRKIVVRLGARRGEVLKDVFMGNEGLGMRDLECWYLDREGCGEENRREWEGRMEVEKQKEEDEGEEIERREGE
jgi:hypothetical protein